MATKTYFVNSPDAQYNDDEFAWFQSLLLTEGVIGDPVTGDLGLEVQEKNTPDMSVDISAGKALVEIVKDGRTFKVVAESNATENILVTANTTGSNRVDAVVMRVSVSVTPNALKNNVATLEVLEGSGTSPLSDGAINTLLGSDGWVRLADITVPDNATEIENTDIDDVRTQVFFNNGMGFAPLFINESAGTADENKVPKLNEYGMLDSSFVHQGGDGADGALSIGAGATVTLNTGQVYNFSSISINATGTLKFSGNDWILIRCSGNADIAGTIVAKGIARSRKGLITFGAALAGGTPLSANLGKGAVGVNGAGNGGDDGTTSPSTGNGGAKTNSGSNGDGTTTGGGGGGSNDTAGAGTAGSNASGKNGGAGGSNTTGTVGATGGGGGAGVDDGNGGNGGSGTSRNSGRGGDGGNSGQNGGNGGNGGSGNTGGRGGDGYVYGGNGGDATTFNNAGYGGRGGDGGTKGGNGGASNGDDGGVGGRGGDGTGGSTPFYLFVEGDLTFLGIVNAFGGDGGDGGSCHINNTPGDGGNGGDGADVYMLCRGTLTNTGTINNYGGRAGVGGSAISSAPAFKSGRTGRDGRSGITIINQVV